MSELGNTDWYAWQRQNEFVNFAQECPITAALFNVMFAKYLSMALEGPLVPERLGIISTEIKELNTWITPPHEPTEQEANELTTSWLNTYANAGCPHSTLVQLAQSLPASLRRKSGRPVAGTRVMATQFLNEKSKNGKLSYVQFMIRNCQCGKDTHVLCAAALRQQVILLRATLEKYGIPCPEAQGS